MSFWRYDDVIIAPYAPKIITIVIIIVIIIIITIKWRSPT